MNLLLRNATLDDVDQIEQLEKIVWKNEGASRPNIVSRITTFPEGNKLVFLGEELLVYGLAIIVDKKLVDEPGLSWDRVTGDGSIVQTHDMSGEYIYGVNITASPNAPDLASELAVRGFQTLCLIYNKHSFVFGSRMPGYAAWLKENPNGNGQEYLNKHLSGELEDYLLGYFSKLGFLPQYLIPDYFPDSDSHNYGVLVKFVNPEYPKPGLYEVLELLKNNGDYCVR